jgi:hypothetical protein
VTNPLIQAFCVRSGGLRSAQVGTKTGTNLDLSLGRKDAKDFPTASAANDDHAGDPRQGEDIFVLKDPRSTVRAYKGLRGVCHRLSLSRKAASFLRSAVKAALEIQPKKTSKDRKRKPS